MRGRKETCRRLRREEIEARISSTGSGDGEWDLKEKQRGDILIGENSALKCLKSIISFSDYYILKRIYRIKLKNK